MMAPTPPFSINIALPMGFEPMLPLPPWKIADLDLYAIISLILL